jgi:hypothetical protein
VGSLITGKKSPKKVAIPLIGLIMGVSQPSWGAKVFGDFSMEIPSFQGWRERWKIEGQPPMDFLFAEDGEGGTSFFDLQK